jgi:hypothetical protein
VQTGDVLETIAGLASQLKQYAAKLPAVVPLTVVPGGMKPTPEAVEAFEKTVYRFRDLGGASAFKRFTDLFIESLEAFEAGRVLAAIQPLLLVLDRLEVMQREKTIALAPKDEARLKEYRVTLHKILPGKEPELEGAGRGL